jgi:hypothetical protein
MVWASSAAQDLVGELGLREVTGDHELSSVERDRVTGAPGRGLSAN